MIHRTIVAAVLAGLASPVLAGQFTGPAYDQAAGLATSHNADAAYDGSVVRTPVQTQVDGALKTGGLVVERPPETVPPSLHAAAAPDVVPEPAQDGAKGKFFTKRGLMFGAGGAAVGAGVGWLVGGPIGALIGALAGFAIGFLVSKLLKH